MTSSTNGAPLPPAIAATPSEAWAWMERERETMDHEQDNKDNEMPQGPAEADRGSDDRSVG